MKKRIFVYLVFTASLVSITGCGRREAPQPVDFNDTVELRQPKPAEKPSINVCIGSMITPEEGYEYYKRLLDYIARKLGMSVNFVERNTYAEVNTLLKNKAIDIAFVCGGPYVEGRDEFGLELLCAPQVDGRPVYYSYIIVSKDSPAQTLEDLRGKRFAFMDPMSNSGRAAPAYILKEEFNETPENFFKEYVYTYDHDKSIRAVSHNLVDAAAVDSLIWNYMYKKADEHARKTRIIKVSEAYGTPPVVVRPDLDPGLKARFKDVFLNMHKDKEGREILNSMFIDRFVEARDSDYDSTRRVKALVKG